MIDLYRKKFEVLEEKEKKKEQKISSLDQPCQFHIISSPDSLSHLIIKTHFVELKDKTIRMIELKKDSFIKQFEEFLKDPIWSSPTKGDWTDGQTLGKKLENYFVSFAKTYLRGNPNLRSSGIGAMMLVDDQMAIWGASGVLNELDLENQVNRIVDGYKKDAERQLKEQKSDNKSTVSELASSPQIKESRPDSDTGYGTYFYPPILIGDLQPTLSDKIYDRKYDSLKEIIIDTEFAGYTLIISKGGLIGIETRDEDLAERILNTIMAIALILGVSCYAIRRSELASLALDKKTHKITSSSWSYSSQRMELFDVGSGLQPEFNWRGDIRVRLSLDDIKLIIKKASEIWPNKEQHHFLKLLLGSFTHLDAGEYSQSFIMSWNVLERHLFELWGRKLINSGVTKRIQDDLDRWDVYSVLEILHLDKEISEDDYQQLRNLQKLRNDVIHEGYEITQKQAFDCYELANIKISNEVKFTEKINTKNTVSI